jgi:hypothetical protein
VSVQLTPEIWKTYWNCIAFELGTLCSVFLFGLVWFFSTLMRQWQNYFWDTISRIGSWGTNTKIFKPKTLFHLNVEIFFIYFFFQYSLCLSNACWAYCWLVHYLSMFISLKLLFVCLFFLIVCLFVFPFFFNFFAFHHLSPLHSKYHHYKLENT